MTSKMDRDQEKINRAQQAEGLKSNPFLSEIFIALKASYFDKLINTKKDDGYERELVSVHESMQNLIRIEHYINRCISEGKVIRNHNDKPDVQ